MISMINHQGQNNAYDFLVPLEGMKALPIFFLVSSIRSFLLFLTGSEYASPYNNDVDTCTINLHVLTRYNLTYHTVYRIAGYFQGFQG